MMIECEEKDRKESMHIMTAILFISTLMSEYA